MSSVVLRSTARDFVLFIVSTIMISIQIKHIAVPSLNFYKLENIFDFC